MDAELERLRAAMDDVNQRLADVLHERARLCRRIGAWKWSHGLAAADARREDTMLASLTGQVPDDGFAADELATILRTVFAASRRLVEQRGAPPATT